MAYGELKVDSITFTDGGSDVTVSVSGLVKNPTFSGDIVVSGNISGTTITGDSAGFGSVTGVTVTGTTANFVSGVFTTQVSGAIITGNTAGFTTITGTTVTGTTANFVTVSGTTVTGDAAQFTSITGGTAGFTTVTGTTVTGTTANFVTVSGTAITGDTAGFTTVTGTTVTGTTANFVTVSGTTVTGDTGNFTSISATTTTITSGVFASGTEAEPSVSVGTTDNGLYSPGTDQVAISTNGAQALYINADGDILVADGNRMEIDEIRARDGAGLKLYDDAGAGIFIQDGGNVGVGTASPSERLEIIDDSNLDGFDGIKVLSNNQTAYVKYGWRGPDGSDQLRFGVGGTECARITSAGTLMHLGGGNTTTPAVQFNGSAPENSMVMLSDGKVGLGTSSPTSELTIYHATDPEINFNINVHGTAGKLFADADGLSIFGAGASGGNQLRFFTDATRAMTIDSSQRVGIGTIAPSELLTVNGTNQSVLVRTTDLNGSAKIKFNADDGNFAGIGLENTALVMRCSNSSTPTERARIDSSGKFIVKGVGTEAFSVDGGAPNNSLIVDSSGRCLVGTSSNRTSRVYYPGGSSALNSTEQIEGIGSVGSLQLVNNQAGTVGASIVLGKSRGASVGSITAVTDGDQLGTIQFNGIDVTTTGDLESCAASIQAQVDGTPGANDMPGRLVFSTTGDGASSPTERMIIDAQGRIFTNESAFNNRASFQTTTDGLRWVAGTSTTDAQSESYAGNVATRYHHVFSNPNGVVGSISTNSSATAYNTSSDYRLKENVVPLTGAVDRLNQLQVHRFNFIADPNTTVDGFLAHEAQAVVPECVTGTKDEVDADGNPIYQGIDQSKIVPLVVAALKEALAEIETLKTRLADAGIS